MARRRVPRIMASRSYAVRASRSSRAVSLVTAVATSEPRDRLVLAEHDGIGRRHGEPESVRAEAGHGECACARELLAHLQDIGRARGSVKSVSVTIVVGEAWNTQTFFAAHVFPHLPFAAERRLHVVLGEELAGRRTGRRPRWPACRAAAPL